MKGIHEHKEYILAAVRRSFKVYFRLLLIYKVATTAQKSSYYSVVMPIVLMLKAYYSQNYAS